MHVAPDGDSRQLDELPSWLTGMTLIQSRPTDSPLHFLCKVVLVIRRPHSAGHTRATPVADDALFAPK